MTDVNTTLGFDAAQAIQELTRLKASIDAYNASVRAAAESTRNFNRVGATFSKITTGAATSMRGLAAATRGFTASGKNLGPLAQGYSQITTSLQGTHDAAKNIPSAIGQTGSSLNNMAQTSAQSFQKVQAGAKTTTKSLQQVGAAGKKASSDVVLSWKSVIRIFAIQTVHRAITLITNAFRDGVGAAIDYGVALAEIQTIGKELALSTNEIDERVRKISESFAQPVEVVAEGLYQTL